MVLIGASIIEFVFTLAELHGLKMSIVDSKGDALATSVLFLFILSLIVALL